MRKSIILALSALVAGGALAGMAQAQTALSQPQGSESGASAGSGAVGPGIGPGTRPGVGPPIGGLDSNPYAEAPASVRKALGNTARANQTARTPSARGSSTSGSTAGTS